MVSPTDPNEVLLTGENSFIRLHSEEGGPMVSRASHWRILMSPGGPGHVLFLKSDLTGDEVRIYSDNIAMTRWLQGEIETSLFAEFGDQDIPVIDAFFSKSGDSRSFWTESVESDEENLVLTWYDFMEPFVIRVEAPNAPGGHGVYSCFIPARRAQMTLDGVNARGITLAENRADGTPSTSSCLAWSETWVGPR